ncbi:RidA family protein [Amycolatopsis circi]|uniref:RidA family protein n=1 Tax=Amycolatopsis circi TaxID=871959 RepID=UPI000E24D432|nr:RidA family protein [Amycolatopsis circi]
MTESRELVAHPHGPRPYAGAAVFGGVIWACGQVPARRDGSVPEEIDEQVRVALDNLEDTLRAAGGSLRTLLKLTVFLADLGEFDVYHQAYLDRFAGIDLPPRTTVQVAGFRGTKRIEIDAVAAVGSEETNRHED